MPSSFTVIVMTTSAGPLEPTPDCIGLRYTLDGMPVKDASYRVQTLFLSLSLTHTNTHSHTHTYMIIHYK